ncbi:MAG TPA: SDR family oxidoreductase [Candidatus Baltobacteraceae bacterium]|nr:SDR family oxidoreductase [Candidatus Baltobacteraceae bacterium]
METNDRSLRSRRTFVGGVGTGIAAVVATSMQTAAARTGAPAQGTEPPPVHNPVDAYPRPPFPEQSQPWPGLASKMTPRPDHGERTYRGSGKLAGRKALITGGDSGMGRAAAIAFAREGADVAINYLPAEEPDAREVVALVRAAGRNAVPLPGDIRSEDFCGRLVSDAVRRLGGLDILVNCAARQHSHPEIAALTTEDFDWTMKTNVYALFWITKAALEHMGPGASIVNTASVQAYDPSENLLDYAQTKAAIVAFTKALAKQVAKRGIRVNAVAPGPIWTPLQVCGGQPTSALPQFGASTPLGRAGQPAELAPVYVALASDQSSYSTGQVFGAAGGSGNP